MFDEIKYRGLWFLPEKPEEKLTGYLVFNEDKGIILELIGSFNEDKITSDPKVKFKVLLGFTINGKKITIFNLSGSSTWSVPGFASSKLYAEYLLIGDVFDSYRELKISNIAFHCTYLDEWVDQHGFDFMKFSDSKQFKDQVTYNQPELITLLEHDEFEAYLYFRAISAGRSAFIKEAKIEQKVYLNIRLKQSISLNVAYQYITKFQNFYSLATAEIVSIDDCNLYHDKNSDKPSIKNKLKLYFQNQHIPAHRSKYKGPHDMLFSMKDASNKLTEITANWLETYEQLNPVFRLYFDTIYNPNLYRENAFLNLLFAIEVFHKRTNPEFEPKKKKSYIDKRDEVLSLIQNHNLKGWLRAILKKKNQRTLRSRLLDLLEKNSMSLSQFIPNADEFVDKVVNTRHYYVHFDERLDESNLIDEEAFSSFYRKLKILIQACLLAEIGFDQSEIKSLLSKPFENSIEIE